MKTLTTNDLARLGGFGRDSISIITLQDADRSERNQYCKPLLCELANESPDGPVEYWRDP